MSSDVLITCLLDLSARVPEPVRPLTVGGGMGLYLKQQHLEAQPERESLISGNLWPPARTTEDIDLLLSTEILVNAEHMRALRQALDGLEFVPSVEFLQFTKSTPRGLMKVDVLTGPITPPERSGLITGTLPRVRARGAAGLHAYLTPEAITINDGAMIVPVTGQASDGQPAVAEVRIPGPLAMMLMKLHAYRDRAARGHRRLAQHHVLDLYRVVAMLSRDEFELVQRLIGELRDHEVVRAARAIVSEHFADEDAPGVLRLRTYVREQQPEALPLEVGTFNDALRDLFTVVR